MGPKWSCLMSIAEKTSFLFLLENELVCMPCLVWSRLLWACWFIFRSGSLDIIRLHQGRVTARTPNQRNIFSASHWSPETILLSLKLLQTNVNQFCDVSQMSIFKILTDNNSMYPNMYQVMYVEKKTIPTLVSSKTTGSVYFFYEVVVCSTKSAALEHERLHQASDLQTNEESTSEQSLTNRRFY